MTLELTRLQGMAQLLGTTMALLDSGYESILIVKENLLRNLLLCKMILFLNIKK